MHPAEAVALVVAEAPLEPCGLWGGTYRLKLRQLLAHTPEGLVAIHRWLGSEERIQHSSLIGTKADVIALSLAHRGHGSKATQPLFRQQTVGAVAQRDHGLAAFKRRQQLRQRCAGIPVLNGPVKF